MLLKDVCPFFGVNKYWISMIYALLTRNFVVRTYALFLQIFLDWKAKSADIFTFWMYVAMMMTLHLASWSSGSLPSTYFWLPHPTLVHSVSAPQLWSALHNVLPPVCTVHCFNPLNSVGNKIQHAVIPCVALNLLHCIYYTIYISSALQFVPSKDLIHQCSYESTVWNCSKNYTTQVYTWPRQNFCSKKSGE